MLMRKEDRNKHLEDTINTSGDKLFILKDIFFIMQCSISST